jgi:hypothetical protein
VIAERVEPIAGARELEAQRASGGGVYPDGML